VTLVLHAHPLSSYCWKVLIGLYELGAPFEARTVDLGDPAARAAFVAMWPTAKIPLLQDGDRVVPETSIQLEYLDRRFGGRLLSADPDARLEARLWDRVFDNYVMTPMQQIVADRLRPEDAKDPLGVAQARGQLQTAYGMVEARFVGDARAWAAGEDFGLADCAAAPSLFYAHLVEPFGEDRPALAAYLERLIARPSVARVLAEARPVFQYFPYRERLPARFWDPEEAQA
jgi:glutathione S-transferase